MNSKTIDGVRYDSGLNVLVGGNSLGRGVTFPGLHTVYYCRSSKTPQADTCWQHARIFGYDRDAGLCRIFTPEPLAKLFRELNEANNALFSILREKGPDAVHILTPAGTRPTRKNVLNVYLNVFDQFIKHVLHVPYYVRYADDFVLLSRNRRYLEQLLPIIENFLERELHLRLHPDKIELRTVASGVDFLGWVHFPHHRVLRTTTKRRMIRATGEGASEETVASYRGLLKHGNGHWLLDLLD